MAEYVYSDEDEDMLMRYTVYSSRAEMRAVESGEYFERLEAKEESRRQKKRDALDGLLDMLELTGKCRECPNVCEMAEGFIDENGLISNEQYMYLEHNCKLCVGQGGGKGTGVVPEKVQKWLDQEWNDRFEWAKDTLPKMSCAWCPNAFRIYGQYKDPDDERKAIESQCANCKYFQEV